MLEGVELASTTITCYTIVEKLYLQRHFAIKGDLPNAIITLYTAVLEFLLKAEKYYQKSTLREFHDLPNAIKSCGNIIRATSKEYHTNRQRRSLAIR